MPHFVIDCSENIVRLKSPEEIMQEVFDSAESTGLFDPIEIKVRINPFTYYNNGNTQEDFIHVFGYVMEGRNTEQKSNLSRGIILKLKTLFPNVPVLSINIKDFEKSTYCNKSMV